MAPAARRYLLVAAIAVCLHQGWSNVHLEAGKSLIAAGKLFSAELAFRECADGQAQAEPRVTAECYTLLGRVLLDQTVIWELSGRLAPRLRVRMLLEAVVCAKRSMMWQPWKAQEPAHLLDDLTHRLSQQPWFSKFAPKLHLFSYAEGPKRHRDAIAEASGFAESFVEGDEEASRRARSRFQDSQIARMLEAELDESNRDRFMPEPPQPASDQVVRADQLWDFGYRAAAVQLLCTPGSASVQVPKEEGTNITRVVLPPDAVLDALTFLKVCGGVVLRGAVPPTSQSYAADTSGAGSSLGVDTRKGSDTANSTCQESLCGFAAMASEAFLGNPVIHAVSAQAVGEGSVVKVRGMKETNISSMHSSPMWFSAMLPIEVPSVLLEGVRMRRLMACYNSTDLEALAARGVEPCSLSEPHRRSTSTAVLTDAGSSSGQAAEPLSGEPQVSIDIQGGRATVSGAHGHKGGTRHNDAAKPEAALGGYSTAEAALLASAMHHSRLGHFDASPQPPPPGFVIRTPLHLTSSLPFAPLEFVPGSHVACSPELRRVPRAVLSTSPGADRNSTTLHGAAAASFETQRPHSENSGPALEEVAICPAGADSSMLAPQLGPSDVLLLDARVLQRYTAGTEAGLTASLLEAHFTVTPRLSKAGTTQFAGCSGAEADQLPAYLQGYVACSVTSNKATRGPGELDEEGGDIGAGTYEGFLRRSVARRAANQRSASHRSLVGALAVDPTAASGQAGHTGLRTIGQVDRFMQEYVRSLSSFGRETDSHAASPGGVPPGQEA